MLRSMTAYSRLSSHTPIGYIVIEIQALNRKFLEINLNLPADLRGLDVEIRRLICSLVWCGQLNINITCADSLEGTAKINPNIPLAKGVLAALKTLALELGLPLTAQEIWQALLKEPALLQYRPKEEMQEDNQVKEILLDLVQKAVAQLIDMKEREGMELRLDLETRLSAIEQWIEQISSLTAQNPQKYKEKLQQKLDEFYPKLFESHDERLHKEIVLFAEKADVSEEITRLRSHISQFELLLEGKVGGVGKVMDFLSQEMNREINTLSTKSPGIEVSHLAVDVKSNLAKMREQIQNVE